MDRRHVGPVDRNVTVVRTWVEVGQSRGPVCDGSTGCSFL